MRIGIVTFWQSYDNYGQLLQCWALQQILIKMGHSPFLIRYKYHDYDDEPMWKKIARIVLIWPYIKKRKVKRHIELLCKKNSVRKFDEFRELYIIKSPQIYYTPKDLLKYPPEAEVYITGSDQVWAQLLNKERSKPFFLNFGSKDIRRISYAPSFAMKSYPEGLNPILAGALNNFHSVSVREFDGIEICKKIGITATQVLDPTLLLKSEDYSIFTINNEQEKKYIFIYSVNIANSEEVRWKQLKLLCKKNGYDVKVTPASGYFEGKELFGCDVTYEYSTINQWLSNIAHARLVVTTSFHGIVFSIIKHTPFLYIPLVGKYSEGNNRIIDLLNTIGLDNRVLEDQKDLESYFKQEIDWSVIESKLLKLRLNSIQFLEKALSK